MLVLSRKTGERIAIGDAVTVTVLRLSNGRVKLGITAPDDVSVLRTEINQSSQGHHTSQFRNADVSDNSDRPGRVFGLQKN